MWNDDADISCHDNYPFGGAIHDTIGFDGNYASLDKAQGIPQTVTHAVAQTHELKPVWLCIQAFTQPTNGLFWWSLPTLQQLRVQAFAAVVHGATGIIFFALDSWVLRQGLAVSMSWQTPFTVSTQGQRDLGQSGINASATLQLESRLLWQGVTTLNAELTALAPAILSAVRRTASRFACLFPLVC